MIDKQQVRNILMQKRKETSLDEIKEKSKQIQHLLMTHPYYMQAKVILFYVSYGKEVATHDLIKQALSTDKTVIVPVSNITNTTIIPSVLYNWDDLQPGSYHILEPRGKHIHPIAPRSIDLILLPGVGFDEMGNRMGHGKGFYDRFVPMVPQAKRIGLSFEFQIVDRIPIAPFDQKVNLIITEKRIIDCK